jgi:signal transduction histidine kinase
MHVLSAGAAVFVLWSAEPVFRLVGWALVMMSMAGAQAAICRRAAQTDGERLLASARAFDVTALVLGSAWGYLGVVLFPANERELQFFIGFLMSGAVLVGVGTQHMRYRTLLLSLLPSFPPYIVRQALAAPAFELIVGGMLSLFLVVMLGVGRVLNGFIAQSIRLRFEKDRLLADLAAARAAADEANVAKSRFLAQASHDLRQPLHAIGLLLESLPEEDFEGPSAAITARIRKSLDELSELFDALLDVTLLDTGQVRVERTVFALGDLLSRMRHEFAEAAAGRGVKLRVAPTRATVDADAIIVRRILHNLVSNALQHSGCRRILVGVRRRGRGLRLEVHDDGKGIAASDQARVFGEFTRLEDGAGRRPAAGLGLGLAIVKRLADILGMDVMLRSTPGRGSVFALGMLPRARHVARAAIPSEPAPSPLGVARVLVIDDDRATLAATASLLRKWGCVVDARTDWPGDDASTTPPDLVICDYAIGPARTALEVIDEVRDVHGASLPAVVITGDSAPEVSARASAAGLLVLHKPVRPGQLRSAMLHAVARSAEAAG